MVVSSITGSMSALTSQSLNASVSLDQPAKWASSTNNQSLNQTVKSNAAVDADTNNRVSSVRKQKTDSGAESQKKSTRFMSHMVEVYNLQGKKRIKFMDSHNNVIYQIPAEMVAKMEDLMMKTDQSTDING